MKKINILKKNYDFDRIIQNNKPFKYKYLISYMERDTNDLYKFGISIGKKIGSAVERNKIKRQIKSILDKKYYKNDFNCIIIIGKGIKKVSYKELEKDLLEFVGKLDITKGEIE